MDSSPDNAGTGQHCQRGWVGGKGLRDGRHLFRQRGGPGAFFGGFGGIGIQNNLADRFHDVAQVWIEVLDQRGYLFGVGLFLCFGHG